MTAGQRPACDDHVLENADMDRQVHLPGFGAGATDADDDAARQTAARPDEGLNRPRAAGQLESRVQVTGRCDQAAAIAGGRQYEGLGRGGNLGDGLPNGGLVLSRSGSRGRERQRGR